MNRSLILAIAVMILGGAGWMTGTIAIPAASQSASTQAVKDQTETFAIQNMFCALCPITVRKAMERVVGVKSVKIDFDAKTATVVFDPAVTNAASIAAASTDAGYPASIKG